MTADRVVLYVLSLGLLLNLCLTLRLAAYAHRLANPSLEEPDRLPELEIGQLQPGYRARLASGGRVTERSFAAKSVAYVFLSPNCGGCATTFPQLQRFHGPAHELGVEIVVVTDTGPKQTSSWLDEFRANGVTIETPVIQAHTRESDLVTTYNGPGLFPYYCFIDHHGRVQSRGVVGKDEWLDLIEWWAGRTGYPLPDAPALVPGTV